VTDGFIPPVLTAAVMGGGIGGLAAAVALREIGVDATVHERAAALEPVGAGISLWPNATRVLERLGVLDALLPEAGAIRGFSIRSPSGDTLNRAGFDGYATPAICAHRADLIAALADRLPRDSIVLDHELVAMRADEGGVDAAFRDGDVVRADIAVGADGIRSTVRAYILDDGPPVYRGQAIWRGIGPLPAGMEPGEIFETVGDGVRFGLLDCGRGRAYWYAAADRPDARDTGDADARKAELLRLFGDWHAPIGETIRSTPAEAILRDGSFDRTARRPWYAGRVVLLGDAAHPTTPNQGQGGCMALEDAVVLARCLAGAPDVESAFRAFEAARFGRTRRVTRDSRVTGRVMQARGWRSSLRNAVLASVPAHILERSARWLFQHDAAEVRLR
jgi:2-polyprenyl-6-methoxyphenol hydroxylase-like FAD-dependent oxidoreductase